MNESSQPILEPMVTIRGEQPNTAVIQVRLRTLLAYLWCTSRLSTKKLSDLQTGSAKLSEILREMDEFLRSFTGKTERKP